MIESIEGYVVLLEQSSRNAITETAPMDVWVSILESRPDQAADVAMNKNLPASILDRLIAGKCSRARSLVAMKRSLNDEAVSQTINRRERIGTKYNCKQQKNTR